MKVLVLSNLYPPDVIGGYELVCRQAADALRDRGHDVRVLTSAPRVPVPTEPNVRRTLQLADVWSHYLYSFERNTPAALHLLNVASRFINAHNVHGLLGELEAFEPDVVYIHNLVGLGGLGLLGCLQFLKVPWVWQLGDRVPHYLCCKWEHVVPELAREFERLVQGHFIASSTRLIEEIAALGVRLNGPVDLIPLWVLGAPPPERTEFFRPGGHLRIVSAGQMIRNKGMDLVIEAAARLYDSGYRNFSVDLYGKVADPFFSALIRKHGLGEHVRLRGEVPQAELLARYRRYDLFAFPTWEREPFGLGPLEAGSRGCVAVMTRSCGVAEWFVHGVHCLKAARSAGAFAEAMRAVLDGAVDLEPLGRRIATMIWRDLHIDRLLPRIEAILERAAGRPRRGAGSAADAYRLALLGEKLAQTLVQEPLCA